MPASDETIPGRQTFRDVLVMPIESFHQGAMVRGGPAWPRFPWQVRARHSRGLLPIPRDAAPSRLAPPEAELAEAAWVGPVSFHFGHQVADFGMRLAASAYGTDGPLLFAMRPEDQPEPPAFFWQILEHLAVDPARVVLARVPTLVRRLHVFPPAERRGGLLGPSRRHLDLMDRITARPQSDPGSEAPRERVYVSRSKLQAKQSVFTVGQLAGEAYFESLLAGAGVTVVHPEEITVAEQMDLYRRAALLVFAEGSALHGLQLLGRIGADVAVINRRRWSRVGASSLRPRARSLTYVSAIRGVIHGLRPDGRPDKVRGIAVLEPSRLLDRLARLGLDLRAAWDRDAYLARRDRDIEAWIAATVARDLHPGAPAAIEACLRRLVRGR